MIDNLKEAAKTVFVAGVVFVCILWPLIFPDATPPDEETLKAVGQEVIELVARLAAAVVALVAYIKSLVRKEEIELEYYRINAEREIAELAHKADLKAIEAGVRAPGGAKRK